MNPLQDSALADLAAIMPGHPDAIMIPKTGGAGAGDVARLSHYLDVFEAATGLARGETRILPVATETAADTLKPMEFADTALPSLAGLTGGAEDLSTALGASTNLNPETEGWGLVCRLARAQVLLAARAAGVAAFDTLHVDFRDEDGLRKSSAAASEKGFTGRIAIHPARSLRSTRPSRPWRRRSPMPAGSSRPSTHTPAPGPWAWTAG